MDNDPIPPAFPSLPFPSILFSSLPFSSLLLPSLSFSSLLFSVPIHRLAHILSQFTSSHLFFYFQSFIIHFSSLLFHSYLFFQSCTEPTAVSFLPSFLHSVPPSFLPHCNLMSCRVTSCHVLSCHIMTSTQHYRILMYSSFDRLPTPEPLLKLVSTERTISYTIALLVILGISFPNILTVTASLLFNQWFDNTYSKCKK